MKASWAKDGWYYQPAIIYGSGTKEERREILYGDPLVTHETALKYAQIEINERRTREKDNHSPFQR